MSPKKKCAKQTIAWTSAANVGLYTSSCVANLGGASAKDSQYIAKLMRVPNLFLPKPNNEPLLALSHSRYSRLTQRN